MELQNQTGLPSRQDPGPELSAVLHSGAGKHVLVLEASRARNDLDASSTSDDGVASAMAALPFVERLSTDSLIDANSSNGLAELDFAQVPLHRIPSPEDACLVVEGNAYRRICLGPQQC